MAAATVLPLDVVWQQSSWNYSHVTAIATHLSEARHFMYSDGKLIFTGNDFLTNNYIILSPIPNGYLFPYVTNYTTFTTATLSTYVSPGYLVQQYDPFVSADRSGSVRYGYTATGPSANAYTYGRYLYSKDKHLAITEHTNLFVLFNFKTDAITITPSKFNLILQYGNDAWSWSMSQYVSNFPFPSRDWTINAGQFNISTNVLRNTTWNVPGTITEAHRMVLWFNIGNLIEHPTASAINPISNSVWFDNVIFAHTFETHGMFVSAPFTPPQYHLSGGTVYRLRTIKSVTIGGFIGQTNTNGYGCMMVTNHADPNRCSPGALIRVQIRSGTSYADVQKRRWAGSNAYDQTLCLTNGFTNTSSVENLIKATNLGLIVTNAPFYQYRASISSSIQGVTPVLTNVSFVFTCDATAETFFRQPCLISKTISGGTMTLLISNFYDPIVSRIAAYDMASGFCANIPVLEYEDAPFSAVRRIVLDLTVPYGNYSLLISNQNDTHPVIVTNAFMFTVPTGHPIDTAAIRRTYVAVDERLSLTFRCNFAGTRTLTFDIFSTGGRLMHRHTGIAIPGDNNVEWAARGRLPAGVYVYLITLRSESGTVEQKRGMFAVVK